jgi:hypothetical protein
MREYYVVRGCRRSALFLIAAALAVYLCVFHTLSNMPLHDALLFGVHARFWMQPNALMFLLAGITLRLAHQACCTSTALRRCKLQWLLPVLTIALALAQVSVVHSNTYL